MKKEGKKIRSCMALSVVRLRGNTRNAENVWKDWLDCPCSFNLHLTI